MVSKARREAIRRYYRRLRLDVDKTQLEVEAQARLDAGRYWKIENGISFPKEDEREPLARALRVKGHDLPSETVQPEAMSA